MISPGLILAALIMLSLFSRATIVESTIRVRTRSPTSAVSPKSNLENYLNGHAVQTDGSSVVLPGIATLNDGKVDLIPDPEVIWYIDYNYEHTDPITKLPIGTLRIPS